MCTVSELSQITEAVIKSYKRVYQQDLKEVILYGPYARGDNQEDSDIDIVAIVKGNRGELQKKLRTIWDTSSELELEYGTIISPTVIPLDEFERYRRDIPYYRNIEEEGIRIA